MEKFNNNAPVVRKITPLEKMKELEQNVAFTMSTKQLQNADIPDYQRDTVSATVARLTVAMLNNELIPPIMVFYKPEKNGGVPYHEALNYGDERLDDLIFTIIDGKHRRLAAINAGLPIGAYCSPYKMKEDEETQTFIKMQYGQRVNSNHLIAIDQSKPENRWTVKLATDKGSPLLGKIYLGKGRKSTDLINASNFTQLVTRKIITAEELWPFAMFYAKLFLGKKIYSGGFKGCAYLWKYLQGEGFDLNNREHCGAFKSFDWNSEENVFASKLNSNEASLAFGQRLIKVWKDYKKSVK